VMHLVRAMQLHHPASSRAVAFQLNAHQWHGYTSLANLTL
jgi:hypothetical protein